MWNIITIIMHTYKSKRAGYTALLSSGIESKEANRKGYANNICANQGMFIIYDAF